MTSVTNTIAAATNLDARTKSRRIFQGMIGVAGVTVLLQAVWAGLFIQEGSDYTQSWVDVHARGADFALFLAVVATIYAFVKLRSRRDLWIGSGALAVLLGFEAFIGGLVGAHPNATILHFPLGMALMGLAVWLPLRAGRADPL